MRYLLDTNSCIFIINRKPASVRERFKHLAVGDVAVSAVTVSELEYGIARSARPEKNRAALEKFLLPLEVLDFNRSAARCYGEIRRHLEAKGTPIGSMDMMIAAHALAAGLILVTNNTGEFARVSGLTIEDWTQL